MSLTLKSRTPHLAGERIEVRFDPLDPALVEIYFEGKPEATARLVDAVLFSQRVIVKDRQELIIGTHNLHACGLINSPRQKFIS